MCPDCGSHFLFLFLFLVVVATFVIVIWEVAHILCFFPAFLIRCYFALFLSCLSSFVVSSCVFAS